MGKNGKEWVRMGKNGQQSAVQHASVVFLYMSIGEQACIVLKTKLSVNTGQESHSLKIFETTYCWINICNSSQEDK